MATTYSFCITRFPSPKCTCGGCAHRTLLFFFVGGVKTIELCTVHPSSGGGCQMDCTEHMSTTFLYNSTQTATGTGLAYVPSGTKQHGTWALTEAQSLEPPFSRAKFVHGQKKVALYPPHPLCKSYALVQATAGVGTVLLST